MLPPDALPDATSAGSSLPDPLTVHERAVLELVALGLSNRLIGERLWITQKGVSYHISNLLAKFQVETRTGLVARAYAGGLLEPGTWPPKLSRSAKPSLTIVSSPRSTDR